MHMKAVFCAVAAAALAPVVFPQEIRIAGGLAPHQVLQRGPNGTASAAISGMADKLDGKTIEVRLGGAGSWTKLATVAAGKWAGNVPAIKTGGPYTVEFRAPGAPVLAVPDVLVGDLWILAGQSNMEGVGDLVDVQPPDPKVHSFDQSDVWDVAKEPLHSLRDAVDRIHWAKNPTGIPERLQGDALQKYREARKKGAGLGLPFAVEMVRRTGVPVGLVPCAHGGTSMAQWDPSLKAREGDSLYGSMFRRFQAVGGHVAGVLWYQGESDANPTAQPLFEKKFTDFIAAVRSDFGQPDLPFYWAQIGRHISNQNEAEWNAVQESQRVIESKVAHAGMISAIDVDLDDGIHVSTQDQKRLGHRFAILATHAAKIGPHPMSATYQPQTPTRGVIRVRFDQVNGTLRSDGRMSGFTVHDADGTPISRIYKSRADTDGSTVLLYTDGAIPGGATLRYGYGKNPYCNLRDAEDMGVPVFGPMPIGGVDVTSMEKPVAIINGRPVTATEMRAIIDQYPIFVKRTIPGDPMNFLMTHVFMQTAVKAARESGVDQKQPYKYNLDLGLMNAYLNEIRNHTEIHPDEQLKYYEANKDKYKQQPYETVRDQVYIDMLNDAQNKRIADLKARGEAKVVDPEFFKNYKPE